MNAVKKVTIRADAPEDKRDEANLLKAEMNAEYKVGKKDEKMNRPPKGKGRQYLKAEFKRGKQEHPAPVEDRAAYRAHILAHSLFPNVFNRETVMKYEGAS